MTRVNTKTRVLQKGGVAMRHITTEKKTHGKEYVWMDGMGYRTLQGTTRQSPDRSMDPDRWQFGERSTVHTAAL